MPLEAGHSVLIAGAGYVGSALAAMLCKAECRVVALRRRSAPVPSSASELVADLADPRSLEALLPEGLRSIVYLVSPDQPTDEAYRAAYVDGLTRLFDCPQIRRAPLERVLFASSTAVYAQDDGSWVDEFSPTLPEKFNGRRLLEAERLLRSRGVPHSIVRFAGIYGPGRQRLLTSVLEGTARIGVPHITNRIHRDDCAGFLLHLLDLDEPDALYLGVDSEPAELGEVLVWLAQATGRPRPGPSASGERGRGGNKRCSNRRLRESGYRLKYPSFREGYAELIAALATD